jgi:DNA-directed RNA polymerase alpha subunit
MSIEISNHDLYIINLNDPDRINFHINIEKELGNMSIEIRQTWETLKPLIDISVDIPGSILTNKSLRDFVSLTPRFS